MVGNLAVLNVDTILFWHSKPFLRTKFWLPDGGLVTFDVSNDNLQNVFALDELAERAEKIKKRYATRLKNRQAAGETLSLTDSTIFEELMQEEEPELKDSCSVCR